MAGQPPETWGEKSRGCLASSLLSYICPASDIDALFDITQQHQINTCIEAPVFLIKLCLVTSDKYKESKSDAWDTDDTGIESFRCNLQGVAPRAA